MRRAVVLAAVVLGALVPSASAETALNIVPHGASEPGVDWAATPGILPAEAEATMYDRLTPLFRDVTDAQLAPSADGSGYFKSEALLPEDDPSFVRSDTVSGAVPGHTALRATVKRDRYGVPHVYSSTDAGVIFGAGYVTAEDRNLVLDQARFNSVAALIDVPGITALQLVLGFYDYQPSAEVVRTATARQTRAIEATGARGRRLLSDIDTYVAGINTWYAQHKPATTPFTRTDIYALNALKGQYLGEGGGQESPNGQVLDALRSRLGTRRGDFAFQDLKGRNDPEAPVTTTKRFDWQTDVSVSHPSGLVRLRYGSFRTTSPKLPGVSARSAATPVPDALQHMASNVIIASGKRSATGAPLLVGGPQLAYNYPGLTLEMGLYGPHIRVRGITSSPFPGYMLIGRGQGFAWTVTSAAADVIDVYAERLCGGSTRRYRYKGRCRAMEQIDAGTISKGGQSVDVRFPQSVHGPVIGYARETGTNRLVALSWKRSSAGRDTTDQLFFQQLTYGRVHSARSFIDAAEQTPQTFNAFYASRTESAFYTTGRLPMRAPGVDPDLPVDGQGDHEWKGFLPPSRHPQVVDPANGVIVNWNNKPARDFPASDERWNEQPLERVVLLERELARRQKHTLASILAVANAAATQDARIVGLWPTLKRALATGKAPSPLAARLPDLLQRWYDAGGSRRDADRDGLIDDPGVAILDEAWPAMSDAALCDRLGDVCQLIATRNPRWEAPPLNQHGGWYQYLYKDLRSQLGDKVEGPYHQYYCGNGLLQRCVTELWAALDAAGRRLAAEQGPDPAAWRKPAAPEAIHFTPLPLLTMQYANRPTDIQQVVTFGP